MTQTNPMREKMASKMPTGKALSSNVGIFNKPAQKIVTRKIVENHPNESKSGTCAYCKSMAGKRNSANGKLPPYHPNCKCSA